jgi:hypothetical protein
MSDSFYSFFESEGLAVECEDDWEWLYFEPKTALLYMATLAKYLAEVDNAWPVPGTDRADYESLIYQAPSEPGNLVCLSTRFKDLLPVPQSDVPLPDILAFKQKRNAELMQFCLLLDDFQKDLAACEQPSDVKAVTAIFDTRLRKGVQDLEAALQDAALATITGSLKTLVKADSTALWSAVVVAAGRASKLADVPLSWAISGLGVLGAVEIATFVVDRRNQRRATLRDSPFAYLYYARQAGIV